MVKQVFIYAVIIIFVGLTAWFLVDKAKKASQVSDIGSLVSKTTDKASPSPSAETEKPEEKENKWIKLKNGLEMQDIVIGAGKEAVSGDAVAAHYIGTLANGKKFDSSYDRGQPFAFILGGGMVIKGWDLGVVGMKIGGKRKLVIPPELGYGSRDVGGGAIPPNSTLFFEIELVATETLKK